MTPPLVVYHLRINENDVSNDLLTPGWSDFNTRVYYNSYEVTEILKSESENVINVIVADGYYSGYCGWERRRGYYGKFPALKLQLMIDYEDGSSEIIATDESWTSAEGPIGEADILMGEVYDSNFETLIENWDSLPNLKFKNVNVRTDVSPQLKAYGAEPVRIRSELVPKSIWKIGDKKFIIDFAQNFAGFVKLKLQNVGKRKILLRFAEMLDNEGSLYTENLRMARAQDIYYSRGHDEEIWQLRRPPLGSRNGLLPILLVVALLEHEHEIALYENGTFLSHVAAEEILRLTKAPHLFELQLFKIQGCLLPGWCITY